MIPEKIHTRLIRLQGLAAGGSGGERKAAQAQYEKLLARHGLTPEAFSALQGNRPGFHSFEVNGVHESTLLSQIVGYVTGQGKLSYRRTAGAEAHLLTPEQARLVTTLYTRHRKELTNYLALATRAYVSEHGLLAPEHTGGLSQPGTAALDQMRRTVDRLPEDDSNALTSPRQGELP